MATKTTKIQAVNTLLSNIGQAPTTTLDTTNPQVSMAERVLDEVSNDVQAEGWAFNTEYGYPFSPELATSEIVIPENVLAVDAPDGVLLDVVIRNNKLYDRITKQFQWTRTQFLDVVWLFDFEELPEHARQYILIRAANLFAMRATGSTEVAKYSEKEEAHARSVLMTREMEQGDYSIFSNGTGMNPLRTSTPLDTIWRY